MLKTTRWRPDTCGCVIEYEWDDTTSESERVHTPISVVNCPAHPSGTVHEKYAAVLGENQRKNRFLYEALTNVTGLRELDSQGNVVLKGGVTFSWFFDAQRVLHVSFTGVSLTGAQRNLLISRAEQLFGAGKVVFD